MKKEEKKKMTKAKDTKKQTNKGKKKSGHVLLIVLLVLAALLVAGYTAGAMYYQHRFLRGTVINGIDVSGMDLEKLKEEINYYELKVLEKELDGEEFYDIVYGDQIGIQLVSEEPAKEILQAQNSWNWLFAPAEEHTLDNFVEYDEAALADEISRFRDSQEDTAEKPVDAHISDFEKGSGYRIIPETEGHELNVTKTAEVLKNAVSSMQTEVALTDEGCYEKPAVYADDVTLLAVLDKMNLYTGVTITYSFGSEKEVLDGEAISEWLTATDDQVKIDSTKVREFVAGIRKAHDTIFRSRKFMTSYGKEITISDGDYGWWMNTDQEVQELTAMIEEGKSGEKTPAYYQTAASYDTPDYGNTYVEVNLTAQHLFLYVDGSKVLESDFVSGNTSRNFGTPSGVYGITYKQRQATLVGENYSTPVDYWMPFNGNIGLHDATWRTSFGKDIYKTSGSHGCVNLPYAVAQKIYENVEKGTAVICYNLSGTETVTTPETPAVTSDTGEQAATEETAEQ